MATTTKRKNGCTPPEVDFARLFRESTEEAYRSALESGAPVVIASDGEVVQLLKQDNQIHRVTIKELPSPVSVPKNRKIIVKS